MGKMTDTRKQKAEKSIRNADQALTVREERANRIVGSPRWWSSINYNRSMPKDLKLSQTGSSPLLPPFRGLHSPGVRKRCQIIFACYFRKSSIKTVSGNVAESESTTLLVEDRVGSYRGTLTLQSCRTQ